MASAITHFIVGAALAFPAMNAPVLRGVMPPWVVSVAGGLLAAAPDLDTIAMQTLDIPHGSLFAHRGVFHSAAFLLLLVFVLSALVARPRWRAVVSLGLVWWVCAVTHPLLDMLTDGGSGVMILFPFTESRLFFPWRPIRVSPLGIIRFFSRAGEILASEAPFDVAAVALGLAGRVVLRRRS